MSTHCLTTNCDTPSQIQHPQTAVSATLFAKLVAWWSARRQHKIDRDAFKHLLSLDDSLLKDIGVTRADVTWASQLPKSVDAAVELEIIVRRRGKRDI